MCKHLTSVHQAELSFSCERTTGWCPPCQEKPRFPGPLIIGSGTAAGPWVPSASLPLPEFPLTWRPLCSPRAGGGRGQAHESLHQHDREETLQHIALREQPGQLQVKVGGSRRVFSIRTCCPLASVACAQSQGRAAPPFWKPLGGGRCLRGSFRPLNFRDPVLSCQP